MKKRICTLFILLTLLSPLLVCVPADAKTPEIMASLRSYIKTYGPLGNYSNSGLSYYTTKISYQKSKKRFLFQCTNVHGSSVSTIKMYMPAAKKKASYTVYFHQTIVAGSKKGIMSGKAALKKKTYNNSYTNLKFSRKNKNKAARKIPGSYYQAAGNSQLQIAFWLWENSLEKGPTLCFRNFGFKKVSVYDPSIHTNEW